jgi:hypothetical protein
MALSDKDIAKLYTSLELPIVAGEALAEQHMLDPDEEYAFHKAMSDMQPDAALLCMALCAEQIYFTLPSGIMEADALLLEIDRILSIYGALWLVRITEDKPVPEEFILDALKGLPEDHKRIRSLMADLDVNLPHEAQAASQLLGIMQIQAEANVMIAETHLEALGIKGVEEKGPYYQGPSANDNGAVFPVPN